MGLGNPGTDYKDTYHNIGIIFLDSLSDSPWKRVSRKHFVYREMGNFTLVKPTVFMNESGIAAREALAYFKTTPASLIVAHDDSDFFWGLHKLAFGQGAAGHKGVESVIAELDTKKFWRLRIGIRADSDIEKKNPTSPHPPHKVTDSEVELRRVKAGNFVLKKLTKKHRVELKNIFLDLQKEIEKTTY